MKIAKADYTSLASIILPLDELNLTVDIAHPDVYMELIESLKTEPLEFPLVAVYCQYSAWHEFVKNQMVLKSFGESDSYGYFVTCGNNRARALKELGYTHVSVISVPRYEDGSPYCKQMRKWYDKKCGRRNRE
jgi:hypothetical protein